MRRASSENQLPVCVASRPYYSRLRFVQVHFASSRTGIVAQATLLTGRCQEGFAITSLER